MPVFKLKRDLNKCWNISLPFFIDDVFVYVQLNLIRTTEVMSRISGT